MDCLKLFAKCELKKFTGTLKMIWLYHYFYKKGKKYDETNRENAKLDVDLVTVCEIEVSTSTS